MQHSCPPDSVFPPHFIKFVVEVKVVGTTNELKLRLEESNCMLLVNYLSSNKDLFVSVVDNTVINYMIN